MRVLVFDNKNNLYNHILYNHILYNHILDNNNIESKTLLMSTGSTPLK